jgi:hypothetical protein
MKEAIEFRGGIGWTWVEERETINFSKIEDEGKLTDEASR